MGLLLSANLKWVAYLNFKQKWKSILLVLLITIYLFYFFMTVYVAPATDSTFEDIKSLFVVSLFTFLMFYSLFSLLVILFNLPTSSVFEKKMEEAINFQRLSQSIQQGENETQIFDILLSSAMSAVYADAGWIEILRPDEEEPELRSRNVSRVNISTLRAQIAQSKQRSVLKSPLERSSAKDRVLVTIKKSNFRSILIIPMEIQGDISGYMYLLNELSDGINKEMISIINTFVSQASISVENFRLMGEALENERYKEELNIAKSVQRALLPDELAHDEHFDIHSFTEAAAEVGGDYYDTFRLGEHKFAVVIGDVSGKGTSAAFHMSQMKGIFQSLAQLNLSAKDFLVNANNALSQCLEKTSFITLSYFIIDTEKRALEFSRAGHCPTLYYCKKESEARFFQNKGLGLGILRNDRYEKFVEVNHMTFEKDDVLVLYTDGISEAANETMEEFGYERLQTLLEQNHHYDPVMIQKIIISKLYEFCGNKDLNDDYTIVVIKFK
jgi:serine phosphatase RsbU (regulator of sigma subunit)